MTQFLITLDPGSPGIARLGRIVERARDKAGLLQELGDALLGTTQDRFKSETDPSGAAWAPLAPRTVEKRGRAHPILRDTGKLFGSLTAKVAGEALQLGPNTVYAAVQNFGHTFAARGDGGKGVVVPQRQYVGFGAEDERATTATVLDWFEIEG